MSFFKPILMTAVGGLAIAAVPAAAQTTTSVQSGPGTISVFTPTGGTSASPWTLTESITNIAPFVVKFTNPTTGPLAPGDSTGIGYAFGKWISLTITNNTSSVWSSFDLELQSVLGTPSVDGDGLSFAQGAGLAYTSNRFSTVQRTEDTRDFLNFNGGSVAIGQSVTFKFAITDNQTRNNFWLVQTPNRVVGGVPEPTTWAMMLLGFGAMGGALRRRPKVATRIRFA